MPYETLIIESDGHVGTITLHRPKALNAINATLTSELVTALEAFEADPEIRCIVLAGSDKAFAAGADITELAEQSFIDVFNADDSKLPQRMEKVRKPVVAAVAGYVLGGGCELAMMCDFVLAAENAKFGLPEITLGTIPGAGGTQRLTRFVGKSKAMEMVLTGRMMDAQEAERVGLVSRVVPTNDLLDEVAKVAERIASMSLPMVIMAKEAVRRAYETTLSEGVRFEHKLFQATFATEDRREGMNAFVEKRQPNFKHR